MSQLCLIIKYVQPFATTKLRCDICVPIPNFAILSLTMNTVMQHLHDICGSTTMPFESFNMKTMHVVTLKNLNCATL